LNELIKKAKELLTGGEVELVIGFAKGSTPERRRAAFCRTAAEIDSLVLDGECKDNLAWYLVRENILKSVKKVAVFLQMEGIRSLNILAAEDQLNPEQIVILGYKIDNGSVQSLSGSTVKDFDSEIEKIKSAGLNPEKLEEIKKLESMTAAERFAFWKDQFSKCIKCYACRQGCPMCYCKRCIVDKNQPQWITTSSHTLGNFEWNIVRAFHLAGRCVGCGNCERACPVGIPLMLLNARMAKEVLENFDHFAGLNTAQEPVLASFVREDPDTFIL
jgi:ferredoxin